MAIAKISTPEDIERELSGTSKATDCFAGQKFSRLLQEYLVEYSLTVSATNLVLSDEPLLKSQFREEIRE